MKHLILITIVMALLPFAFQTSDGPDPVGKSSQIEQTIIVDDGVPIR